MASDDGIVKVPDEAGVKVTLREYKGILWPKFPLDHLRSIETLEARDDDVYLVAYPKSGTHWLWEIVRLLRAGTVDVPEVEKDKFMIEGTVHDDLEAQPSPRTLNTHAPFHVMPPKAMANKKSKFLYVTRDPRDVTVSYFNHHVKLAFFYDYGQGEWKNYFPSFVAGKFDYGSWFEYTKGWEKGIQENPHLQVHITSYEAFQENTSEETRKLAKFLDTPADEALIEQIVQKASFDSMRKTKGANENFKGNLKPVMYRKGIVGDWKNWFTVAQSEVFNEFFEKEMKGTKAYGLYSRLK